MAMAKTAGKSTEGASDETDVSLVTTAPDDWEWATVAEESAIGVIFEEIGDVFVGQFEGRETITPEKKSEDDEPFDRFVFRARDGKRYALNVSYKLDEAMKAVETGQWVRITYMADIPTGRKLNPMKDFRVDVRK